MSLFSHNQAVPLSIHNTFNSHDSINSLDSNTSANTAANAAGHGHTHGHVHTHGHNHNQGHVNAGVNTHGQAHTQTHGINTMNNDKNNNNNNNNNSNSNSHNNNNNHNNNSMNKNSNSSMNSHGIYSDDHNACRVTLGSLRMETGNLVSDRVELASNPPSPTPPDDNTGRSSTVIMSALEFGGSKSEVETDRKTDSHSHENGEIDTACDDGFGLESVSMDVASNERPVTHHRVEFDTVNGLQHGLSVCEPMHTCDSSDPAPVLPSIDTHSYSHPSPSPSPFTPVYAPPQQHTQPHPPNHTDHHPLHPLGSVPGPGQGSGQVSGQGSGQGSGQVSGQGSGQGGQVRPPRHTHVQTVPHSSEVVECNTLTRSPLGGAGAGAGGSNGTAAGKLQEALSKLRQVGHVCYVMLWYSEIYNVMLCHAMLWYRCVFIVSLEPASHRPNSITHLHFFLPFSLTLLPCFLTS